MQLWHNLTEHAIKRPVGQDPLWRRGCRGRQSGQCFSGQSVGFTNNTMSEFVYYY